MEEHLPPDLLALDAEFAAVERDARALAGGLSESEGAWRAGASSWSVAECLDHLASANRAYLAAMRPAAARAASQGRRRRGPARPGLFGRWFVRSLEPPVRLKGKAPKAIRPRNAPTLSDAMASFLAAHDDVRGFVRRYRDIDMAGVRFRNPFVRGLRFSVATGLHVIAAHERRHLWQARRVREAAAAISLDRAS